MADPVSLNQVNGTKWTRACGATLSNGYNEVPQITFHQEVRASFSDGSNVGLGGINDISETLANPTTAFPLLAPLSTGATTATFQDVFDILSSLYASIAAQHQ
jgi:hypothetical protein